MVAGIAFGAKAIAMKSLYFGLLDGSAIAADGPFLIWDLGGEKAGHCFPTFKQAEAFLRKPKNDSVKKSMRS